MQKNHSLKFASPSWLKTLNKLSIEGTCFNTFEVISDKTTAGIMLNDEKFKTFPVRHET